MARNTHLVPQLNDFEKLVEPGFALLINAPWGAGKTFAIERWLVSRKYLYVSLYGVRSIEDIDRAILLARLAMIDNGASRALASIVSAGIEGAASYFKVKSTLKVTDLAQAGLPNLLIFDDLERTEMPVTQLLGSLNRFVEHEKKNVILIANHTELEKKSGDNYKLEREKVIGRAITISADFDAALGSFLEALEPSAAKKFLQNKRNIIAEVFEFSASENLRLLRQSLLEFCRFFERLPDFAIQHDRGMEPLLATFFAVSMAFNGGTLSKEEISLLGPITDDELSEIFLKEKYPNDTSKLPLKENETKQFRNKARAFIKNWENHAYVMLGETMIITPLLIENLIVEGYADEKLIRTELESIFIFLNKSELEPFWQQLWHWEKNEESVVEQALKVAEEQLAARSISDPMIILHLAGTFLRLASEGIRSDLASVEEEMSSYIDDVDKSGALPSNIPKIYWGNFRGNSGAYGLGFTQRETREFARLQTRLFDALDRRFWADNGNREKDMLKMCRDAPENFIQAIDNYGRPDHVPNYAHLPIFAGFDPVAFAETILSLKPEQMQDVLQPFKSRIHCLEETGNSAQGSEREWLRKIWDEAKLLSARKGRFRAAQIKAILQRELGFLAEN